MKWLAMNMNNIIASVFFLTGLYRIVFFGDIFAPLMCFVIGILLISDFDEKPNRGKNEN